MERTPGEMGRRRIFLIALALLYIPLAYYGFRTEVSIQDEHVYFLMGKAVLDGKIPHRDFFSEQMPLMLYAVALIYAVFGVSIAAGKLIPVVSSFTILCLVYLIGERHRRGAGAVACLLLLTLSVNFHLYSHSMFGISFASSVALAGLYLKLKGRDFISGFLMTASIFVRLNTLPLVLIFLALRPRREFLLGVAATAPLFIAFATPNFYEESIQYHMLKEPMSLAYRVSEASKFLAIEAPTVILFFLGAYTLVSFSERKGRITLRIPSDDREAAVTALCTIVLILSVLLMPRPYHYYFTLALPFMALIGARGILAMVSGRPRQVLAVFIVSYLIVAAYALGNVRKTYESFVPEGFGRLIAYVSGHTTPAERILFIGGEGGSYVAFMAGRDIAGDFIDSSYSRFYAFRDRADDDLARVLDEKPALVVMDVSMLSELADSNVSLEHTRQRLLSEYYPSFHVFGSFYPDLMLVWRRLSDVEGGELLPEPDGAAERRYLSVFYTTVDGAPVQTEWLTNTTVEGSLAYVPDVVSGGNIFRQQMIARDLLTWPLYPGKHYVVDGGNVTSEVWVSSVKDGVADLHVVSYKSEEIFSYAHLLYDYTIQSDIELVVYTRLSVPPSRVYYLTYKQVRVSGEQYGRLAGLLSRKEAGDVDTTAYVREKRGILSA